MGPRGVWGPCADLAPAAPLGLAAAPEPERSPASGGRPSSRSGPGECRLTARARLMRWSPCALPSQCPRPQISLLPGTSCKREHEAAEWETGSPRARGDVVRSLRGAPAANTPRLAHPSFRAALAQGPGSAHRSLSQLASDTPAPSPTSAEGGCAGAGSSSRARPFPSARRFLALCLPAPTLESPHALSC